MLGAERQSRRQQRRGRTLGAFKLAEGPRLSVSSVSTFFTLLNAQEGPFLALLGDNAASAPVLVVPSEAGVTGPVGSSSLLYTRA